MKFGISIIILFLSASTWSAEAPIYNNYYSNDAYGNGYNSYYQPS